ncbi:EamA family transporter [Prauserella endophytica]|uniref:EamA family transporter n=1 Tax=Prauserella endophytica TaxID=1592324 RepID=A0ABY2S7Y9_9PSEU|nr:EamA family transporter [Prauserella endophytica]
MAALWLCWGTSFPAIRVLVATLPPLSAMGAVFLVAGLALAVTRPHALRGLRRREVATAAGVGVGLLGSQGLVAVAERHVFAGVAALLAAAIPLWVAGFRATLGDRPDRKGLLGLFCGLGGIVVVLGPGSGAPFGWSSWALLVVAATVSWAAATLWASRSASLPGPLPATVVQLLAGGLVLLTTGALTGELAGLTPGAVEPASLGALGYLVLVDSLAGFALYNRLLRTAPVALVSTYAYMVPVVAYAVGVLMLGEPFEPVTLLGAALILAGVAAETARPKPHPRRASR